MASDNTLRHRISRRHLISRRSERQGVSPVVLPVTQQTRFFVLVMGLSQILNGLLVLTLPEQFAAPSYDALRSHLTPCGLVFILAGLLLLTWQILPIEQAWLPPLSLLLGAAAFGLLVVGFALARSWSGVIIYGLETAALIAVTVRTERPPRFRPDPLTLIVLLWAVMLGTLFIAAPRQFAAPTYQYIRPNLGLWGLILLATAALLAPRLIWSAQRWTRPLALVAAVLVLSFTYETMGRNNALTGLTTYSILALAITVRPFLAPDWLAPPVGRLRNKLIAASVLLVGAALVFLVLGVLEQTDAAYEDRAGRDLATTALLIADQTNAFVTTQMQVATLLSKAPAIQSLDPAVVPGVLQEVAATMPTVTRAVVLDAAGTTVAASGNAQVAVGAPSLPPGLARTLRSHQPSFEVVQSPVLGVPVLALRAPINDARGAFVGVYSNLVSLETLSKQFSQLRLGDKGRIIIVDEQGHVITHPDPKLVRGRADLSALPPVAAALAGDRSTQIYRDGSTLWLSAQATIPDAGWIVLVQQPQAAILAPANRAREHALGFLVLMLLLATGVLVVFTRALSRPIVELAGAAAQLGRGLYDTPLPPAGKDEVGALVRAFDTMRHNLRDQMGLLRAKHDELEAERNRLETLLATVNVAIFTTDRAGRVTLLNPAGEQLLGVRAEGALGRPYLELLRLASQKASAFALTLTGGERITGSQEDAVDMSGRPKVYLMNTAPLSDTDGQIIGGLGAVLDVTERVVMRRELARRTEALEAKTAEQDAFLYTVSHDLKAPLVSIEGMAQMLKTETASRLLEDDQYYIARIVANTRQMATLLEDLLTLSRIGRVETEASAVSLQEILQDVCQGLAIQIGARNAQVSRDGQLPVVYGSRTRMAEIFTNLIDNAIKYTPAERQPEIHVSASVIDGFVQCSVQDNGVGIAPDQRERVFRLFERLPDGRRLNANGSGAGLAIVSRIVQLHHGKIWIEDGPTGGSLIRFTLPATPIDPDGGNGANSDTHPAC